MQYECIKTTCPYCGCGCQMYLEVMDGKLDGTLPFKGNCSNEGKLCIKGYSAHEFVHSQDRLTHPLVRKNGKLVRATWEEALSTVADGLTTIREEHGSDSIAFFSSARSTNEENYLLQKLGRAGFGTNHIDHCARL